MPATTRKSRWPTPAELARTLASGVVPATLLIPTEAHDQRDTKVVKVRSYVGSGGEVYVLAPEKERLNTTTDFDTPALLDLLDVPPVRTELPRARLCVAGWVESLDAEQQRAAAVDIADAKPAAELLAVGHDASLYRLHVAELSLTRGDTTYDVDVDEFCAVEADPVYEEEHEVTGHLQHHHYDDLTQWALAKLDSAERSTLRQVTITGIDRYGLDLACETARGCTRQRVTFAQPVPDGDSLGDALRELNRCPCDPE